MLRAMDAAVAGLRAHQNKLDVIGNNIANVNTFGYKSQNYTFKDTMYQTQSASTEGKPGEVGGMNPSQFGYGSLMGSIATDFTSSTPSYVGGFNAAINGSGFFVTSAGNMGAIDYEDPANPVGVAEVMKREAGFTYTRVGQFTVDANGFVVDATGRFVYGFRPDGNVLEPTSYGMGDGSVAGTQLRPLKAPTTFDPTGDPPEATWDWEAGEDYQVEQLKSVEIGTDGIVKGVIDKANEDTGSVKSYYVILGKVAIANFQNQEGLTKAGNNTFTAQLGDNTGTMAVTCPGEGATPTLMAGYLEASNVDLAKEFSDMIQAERGFQANTKMVTVSDEILQELVNMKR